MGAIADMMLDGTMDCETGEWNFDGEDGPGWPMTSAEAAAFSRDNAAPDRSRTPITNHKKRAARAAMAAASPLGKKHRRWLAEAAYAPGGTCYPGVLADAAPGVLRDLERMGFVTLYEPHNPVHKARYVITAAGREKLER